MYKWDYFTPLGLFFLFEDKLNSEMMSDQVAQNAFSRHCVWYIVGGGTILL